MDNLAMLLITIVILFVIFLILREFTCWYFKINERISIQNQTNLLLEKILSQLKTVTNNELNSTTDETNESDQAKQTHYQEEANTETVEIETLNNELLTIVSVNNKTIGAKVFINGKPAKDGIYIYKSFTNKLVLKDGHITERFHLDRTKNYIFEKKSIAEPRVGDKVYSLDWTLIENGKCKYDMFKSYIVKDGKIV